MADLARFRELITIYRKQQIDPETEKKYTQEALAKAISLSADELGHRLNGNGRMPLDKENVLAIVRTLAQWKTLTWDKAVELLTLMDYPLDSPGWERELQDFLSPSQSDRRSSVPRARPLQENPSGPAKTVDERMSVSSSPPRSSSSPATPGAEVTSETAVDGPFGHLQALPRNGQPTTWPNQNEAFSQVSRRLRVPLIQPVPVGQTNHRTMENRANMLIKLQRMYDEVLDDSLQKLAWIDLPLTSVPGAVHTAANLLLRRGKLPEQPLASGTTVQQVYRQANQELLILGEPGAGKSTLLYQLGRDLLVQAQQPTQPLPVVFPLSSWAQKRLPLQEWMIEQLCSPLYEVPREQSRQWVQNQQILPLLDGLDEGEESARPACIAAINAYRSAFPLCPFVVCSRSQEYYAASQDEGLHLYSAIEVQPLTTGQQEEALQQAGTSAQGLRAELTNNKGLRELTSTPLWLNVLLVATRETPLPPFPQERSALQQEVLRRYVERMCERKGDATRYPLEETTHWLGFLASQMRQRNHMVFALEELQPDWLTRQARRAYHWSVGLVFGLLSGLVFGLLGELLVGLVFGLVFGLLAGLVFGLVFGLESNVTLAEHLVWSWKKARRRLVVGLCGGLLGGLVGVHVGGQLGGLVGGLIFGLPFGLVVGLESNVTLAERLVLPRKGVRRELVNGLLGGLVGGLVFGLLGWLLGWLLGGLVGGLVFGLLVGPVGGLLFGLLSGLEGKQVVERNTSSPGKGVSRSVKNGLLVGLLGGLVFGLLSGLVGGLVFGLLSGLLSGLLGGLGVGLVFGLLFGLQSAFQHLMIRFWLARADSLPWQVISFLNDACERALLKRVGGTYRFLHRLVLDYFADLE